MTLTAVKKNELITQLESAIEDALTGAGVATLNDISGAVSALRTAYDTDPATVTAAMIVAAKAKVEGCNFGSISSSSNEWNVAEAEAAA